MRDQSPTYQDQHCERPVNRHHSLQISVIDCLSGHKVLTLHVSGKQHLQVVVQRLKNKRNKRSHAIQAATEDCRRYAKSAKLQHTRLGVLNADYGWFEQTTHDTSFLTILSPDPVLNPAECRCIFVVGQISCLFERLKIPGFLTQRRPEAKERRRARISSTISPHSQG